MAHIQDNMAAVIQRNQSQIPPVTCHYHQ